MKNVKWLVSFIIVSQLLTAFVGRSLNPFAAYIGDSFQLTHFQIGLLPTALFVGQFLATLPIGFFADYVPTHRLMLTLMLTVGTGFLLLSSIESSYFLLLLFVTLAGLGYGGMHPVTNKMIVQLYPIHKISLQMGLKQMSITLGSALSSILLIALAEATSWRAAIGSAAMLLIVFALGVFTFLQRSATTFRTFQSPNKSLLSQLRDLIACKPLFFTTVIALLLMGLQVTFNTYLLLFLVDVKGWAIYLAGVSLACSEIFGALGRIMWGVISDHLLSGNRWFSLLLISLLFPIALYSLYVVDSRLLAFICVACIGFSLSGFNGVWMNLAVESVPKSISGSASGYSVTFASVGVFIIPPLFGYISDSASYPAAGLFMILTSFVCAAIVALALLYEKQLKVVD